MSSTTPFPPLTCAEVLQFQFSAWYPIFKHLTFKSTVIRPLGEDFRRYLLSDGVHIPEGSEDVADDHDGASASAEEDSDEDEDTDTDTDTDEPRERFAFPALDAQIRQAVADYGAVFPKLNFTAPKDASWLLPSSSPLKCTSPMDVYMLLKSSDFVSHDLAPENIFAGCQPPLLPPLPESASDAPYDLELVLRKWYHVDPAREFRCFIRDAKLIGITQRDANFYEYLNDRETQGAILSSITGFWEKEVMEKWPTADYTFDLVLTRDLKSAHIIDFNPYAPRTDSHLFTYDELADIYGEHVDRPVFKVIDSRSHPAATRSAPANVHNMVPFELLSLSAGQTIHNFADVWGDKIKEAMREN